MHSTVLPMILHPTGTAMSGATRAYLCGGMSWAGSGALLCCMPYQGSIICSCLILSAGCQCRKQVIRESARQEFEAARHQPDPEMVCSSYVNQGGVCSCLQGKALNPMPAAAAGGAPAADRPGCPAAEHREGGACCCCSLDPVRRQHRLTRSVVVRSTCRSGRPSLRRSLLLVSRRSCNKHVRPGVHDCRLHCLPNWPCARPSV
jgi:hypothetical protein